jgi:hypothetical protein
MMFATDFLHSGDPFCWRAGQPELDAPGFLAKAELSNDRDNTSLL